MSKISYLDFLQSTCIFLKLRKEERKKTTKQEAGRRRMTRGGSLAVADIGGGLAGSREVTLETFKP